MQADFGSPQVQQIALTAIASLLGALIAGFFTTRWALQKLRGERAFDRRLDWLEKVLRMLIDTRLALDKAVFSERHGELAEERPRAWTEFQRQIEDLWPVVNACPAYGTARMVAEITLLGTRLKEGQAALVQQWEGGQQQDYSEAYLSSMDEASVLMRGLEAQVEAEIRNRLGLEMFGTGEVDRAMKRATARSEGRLTSDPLLPLKIVARSFGEAYKKSQGQSDSTNDSIKTEGT